MNPSAQIVQYDPELNLPSAWQSDFVRSGVIYQYKCGGCNATYIGKTSRHLLTRASEHLGISALRRNPIARPKEGSIQDHIVKSGHLGSIDNFSILASCNYERKLCIFESLLIRMHKPSLNVQGDGSGLALF